MTNLAFNGDGTVTDNTTGLMWMRCSLGQVWDGKTCGGKAATFTWADALKAAAGHEFAGYTDWRLPNKNELESIVEGRCFTPTINSSVFPATPSTYFWSSSPYAGLGERRLEHRFRLRNSQCHLQDRHSPYPFGAGR